MKLSPSLRHNARRGFSLVEVTIALGIASFCLLGIVGMLPVGLSSKRDSTASLLASGVVNSVVTDLHSLDSSTSATTTPAFKFDLANSGVQTRFLDKDGQDVGTSWQPDAIYRLSVKLTPPTAGERTATKARIIVAWPAALDRVASQWPTKFTGALETVTAIDHN